MWKGVSGDAHFIFNLSTNARSNFPATTEIFDTIWSTQDTVIWLLLNTDTWSPDFTSQTSSITSHSKKSPAISKSEFFNVPVRLDLDVVYLFTHSDHCMRNTVGVHSKFSPNMTPPTPWPDASFTPIFPGQPLISSLYLVGLRVDSHSSVFISLIAIGSFRFRWRNTNSGSRASIWLTGLNSPFACGIEMKAWQSFEVTDWIYLKLMAPRPSCRFPLFAPQIHLDSMINRASRFLAANQIVYWCHRSENPTSPFPSSIVPPVFGASSAIWNPPHHPRLLGRRHECPSWPHFPHALIATVM